MEMFDHDDTERAIEALEDLLDSWLGPNRAELPMSGHYVEKDKKKIRQQLGHLNDWLSESLTLIPFVGHSDTPFINSIDHIDYAGDRIKLFNKDGNYIRFKPRKLYMVHGITERQNALLFVTQSSNRKNLISGDENQEFEFLYDNRSGFLPADSKGTNKNYTHLINVWKGNSLIGLYTPGSDYLIQEKREKLISEQIVRKISFPAPKPSRSDSEHRP